MTTKRQYRLPLEAELEFACRGGSNTGYCWGDDATSGLEHAWFRTELRAGFHPVARKKPNAFGLHDVHGKVGECSENAYTPDGYSSLSAPAQKGSMISAWETI
jgi:formylglycine-generating enzyme required for sulfatase activity